MPAAKLTPTLQERICGHIREGCTIRTAAESSGIARDTYYKWMRTGQNAKSGKMREFYHAVQEAKAEAERLLSGVVVAAAVGGRRFTETHEEFDANGRLVKRRIETKTMLPDWRAAMAMLERRSDEWVKRTKVEHAGELETKNVPNTLNLNFNGKTVSLQNGHQDTSVIGIPASVLGLEDEDTE